MAGRPYITIAVVLFCVLLSLPVLAQTGSLSTPEPFEFDESTDEWHWTVMTGEGDYGHVGQYQRRAKASTSWSSTWTDFVSIDAGDGNENVERRVSIPAAAYDRDTYDYRIRVYYHINPNQENYDDGAYRTSNTLHGYEPTTSSVSLSSSGGQLDCTWSVPSSGAHKYELRSRSRVYDQTTWGSWSSATEIDSSAARSHTLSTVIRHTLEDWQCGVTTVLGTTKSTEATATRSGRGLGPPSNLRIEVDSNTLVAEWSPVPAADSYEYRTRNRLIDTGIWSDWSTWLSTAATRVEIESDPLVYNLSDWEIEARGISQSILGTASSAAWIDGVTILPALPAASESDYTPEQLVSVTCQSLSDRDNGIEVSATYGLASGIQCQEIGADGIGIQSVIDGGFYAAVDIWGYVSQGAQVCFEDSGSLTFLDARTAPRTVTHVGHYFVNGNTCAWLTSHGSVVLAPLRDGDTPQPAPSPEQVTTLQDCMVTTTHVLAFRDGPAGNAFDTIIPYDVTLTAMSRTTNWFEVDFMGAVGWISADYVTTAGSCSQT